MKVMAEENFGPIAAITRFPHRRRSDRARQRLRHGPFGLCVHALADSRAADHRGAEGRHGRASTPSRSRRPRRRSAARTFPAWDAKAASRASATISTSNSRRWCSEMIPNKLKQLWSAGQADDQRLVLDRQRLHRRNHGRAGLRLRHRRRAARRARLFEPAADVAGDAGLRRRSDGARAMAGAGHHHEGARRRRLWHHLPDGEQRATGGGVRELHALPAARAAQLRADARLVRRRRRLRRATPTTKCWPSR